VDKNRDGVVCLKDWTGPDPDPLIGFLVIDNTGRHNNLPWALPATAAGRADTGATITRGAQDAPSAPISRSRAGQSSAVGLSPIGQVRSGTGPGPRTCNEAVEAQTGLSRTASARGTG